MKQIIQNYRTGKLSVENVPVPVVIPGMVLVQNAFSLISAGTERASVELARKSLIAKAKSRPQDFKRVLNLAKKQGFLSAYKTAMARLESPTPLGYSSAGIVLESGLGVETIKPGDRVACAGAGYASHSEVILIPKNLCVRIPDGVPLDWAAFTTLGAIALQGIRQAEVQIGHTIAVIGLGLLGQLTVQLLKASGCKVIGIDIDKEKIRLARESGADIALPRNRDVDKAVKSFTNDYGVDAVIITTATSSNDPFLLAPEIARDRARIVLVGVAKIDFPREIYYRKELSVSLARSYGPGRYDPVYEEKGVDYPIGYVRWTEKRNMEVVLQLMAEKKLNIESLISHRFKIEDAQKAYDMILGRTRQKFLGVLFQYDTTKKQTEKVVLSISTMPRYPEIPTPQHFAALIRLGFIGVGSFAQTSLLPNLKADDVELIGVADIQAHLAKHIAAKYGFKYCTSDYNQILNDKNINTVFIATRHNLHARLIIESLKSGKNVFCEKPLCMNRQELDEVIKVYNTLHNNKVPSSLMGEDKGEGESPAFSFSAPPILFVGFNRRFAPLTLKAKKLLGEKVGPYLINYRINAGTLPENHWLLDPEQGGGRIIGEVCHFVDLISFFIESDIETIYAEAVKKSRLYGENDVLATLRYKDGSIASISYFSFGDKDFPKERIEIFGGGKVCIIDDFKELIFSVDGNRKKIKSHQDKGHKSEILAFYKAITQSRKPPMPFSKIIEATLTTFAINESISTSKAIRL